MQVLKIKIPKIRYRYNLLLAVLMGLIAAYILTVYQPFGTYDYSMKHKNLFLAGYGLILSVSYILPYTVGLFIKNYKTKNYLTPGWEILILLIFFLSAYTGSLLYHNFFVGSEINVSHILFFLKICVSIGFPLIFLIIIIKLLIIRKPVIIEKISENSEDKKSLIVIQSTNKKEKDVSIPKDSICWFASSGNYVEIRFLNEGEIKRKMIRNSLNNVLKQIPDKNFLRIHRFYIINIEKLVSLYTKNSKYYVSLNEGMSLPVSRSYLKQVREISEKRSGIS